MKKYTRRHYNKKLLALGLSAFMGIGLISTGFAVWVMSKDENVEANGNVNVAVMKDSSISLKLWALDSNGSIQKDNEGNPIELTKKDDKYVLTDTFNFDAKKDDNRGRMRYDGDTNGGEDLTVTIKGAIEVVDIDYSLDADLILPPSIQAAVFDKKYLKISDETQAMLDNGVVLEEDGSFTIEIKLEWGEFFKGENPSEYYDAVYEESTEKDPLGKAISDDTMQEQMLTFWKVLTGKDDIENISDIPSDYTFDGKMTVKLTATAKDTVSSEN